MALSEQRKLQLVGVIKKMQAKNEPKERIQQMVNAFSTKFESESPGPLSQIPGVSNEGKIKSPVSDPIEQRQAIDSAKQEQFMERPWYDRAMIGAGAKATEMIRGLSSGQKYGSMGIGPNLNYDKEQQATEDNLSEYQQASQGDWASGVGEVGADMAMYAPLGAGIFNAAKGLKVAKPLVKALITGAAEGLGSSAQHQIQNVGAGRPVSGMETAIETGASAALPVVGNLISRPLKAIAPDILRSSVKPVLAQMDAVNPPDFEEALRRGLVKPFGGLDKAQKLTSEEMSRLGNMRDIEARYASKFGPNVPFYQAKNTMGRDLGVIPTGSTGSKSTGPNYVLKRNPETQMMEKWDISGSGPKGNIPTGSTGFELVKPKRDMGSNVVGSVLEKLESEMKSPKGKLTKETFGKAKDALDYWKEQGLSRSTMDKGKMTVEDALSFRQVIDDKVKDFKKNQTLSDSFDKVSKMLRKELNDFISEKSPITGKLTDEMAKVLPLDKALKRRILNQANNYKMGLLDLTAFGAGAGIGGYAPGDKDSKINKSALLGLMLLGGRRLTSTPGGASMLYGLGKNLENTSKKKKAIMQLLRSTGNQQLGGGE